MALTENNMQNVGTMLQDEFGRGAVSGGDVALALTGADPIAWLRGAYDSEASLEAIVKIDDRLIVLLSPDGLFGDQAEVQLAA